ncbi:MULTISPECIES: hypothetical protein [unclassified Cryobacterium]|uniref:hypothetical protein n=1 Tax=unclassified Cryobacterium TaxID=2649013 RepID=UPI001447F2C6|nr:MULTISPECIES: hypothetical protein [unclassified Cryobacterium]
MSEPPTASATVWKLRALALIASAAVLIAGSYVWGGYRYINDMVGSDLLVAFGLASDVLAVVFTVLGVICGRRAIAATAHERGDASAVAVVFLLVGVFVGTAVTMFLPILPLMFLPLAGTVFVVIWARPPAVAAKPSSLAGRMLMATPFALATFAVVVIGHQHITVWNPLAKVPSLTLDQIYAEMRAAGEGSTSGVMVNGWAALCLFAALALLVACGLPRFAHALDRRRIAVIGLFIVGFAAIFSVTASFGMGMSLADTFATSGADAIATGQAITILGRLAICAAMLVAFLPAQGVQSSTRKPDVPVVI